MGTYSDLLKIKSIPQPPSVATDTGSGRFSHGIPSQPTQAAPEHPNVRTGEQVNTRAGEHPHTRTPEQANRRTGERPITRQSYNVFTDQHHALKRLEAQNSLSGHPVSISDMVRQALDAFLRQQQ